MIEWGGVGKRVVGIGSMKVCRVDMCIGVCVDVAVAVCVCKIVKIVAMNRLHYWKGK